MCARILILTGAVTLISCAPNIFNSAGDGNNSSSYDEEEYSTDSDIYGPGTEINNYTSDRNNSSYNDNEVHPYVYRGTPVIEDAPHMAQVGMTLKGGEEVQWACGGSLISDRFVLTAAHCVTDKGWTATRVRLGVGAGIQNMTIHMVEKAFKHEGYKPPRTYNDIALLKIEQVTFNNYTTPACIHQFYGTYFISAEVAGWGKTETADYSKILLKTTVVLRDERDCWNAYPPDEYEFELPRGIDYHSQICAGGPLSGDACKGDSGGPLYNYFDYSQRCRYEILGIASFGVGCDLDDYPGVYTRVSYYYPWIASIVAGQEPLQVTTKEFKENKVINSAGSSLPHYPLIFFGLVVYFEDFSNLIT